MGKTFWNDEIHCNELQAMQFICFYAFAVCCVTRFAVCPSFFWGGGSKREREREYNKEWPKTELDPQHAGANRSERSAAAHHSRITTKVRLRWSLRREILLSAASRSHGPSAVHVWETAASCPRTLRQHKVLGDPLHGGRWRWGRHNLFTRSWHGGALLCALPPFSGNSIYKSDPAC